MSIRIRASVLAALALVAFGIAPSFASDPSKQVDVASADEARDEHAEMERLIGAVELRLREIDRLLDDASAGHATSDVLGRVAGASREAKSGLAAIDELLKASRSSAQQVVTDIDRILELANHTHPGGT
jgi:hypothetical protein